MKTGLILEGGAMRGIYTAGVLDVFAEHGLHFDGVIGVSAGALHGCSFVSGQKGRSLRYFLKYRNDKHFMSIRNLLLTGDVVGKKLCYEDIPERLDPFDYEAFAKTDTKFYAVCTNVDTGKAEYIRITDMLEQMDVMRASASMPFVSRIVRYKGKKLLDGGCADSIPIDAFRRMGYGRNVIVLTRDASYVKPPENGTVADVRYHRHPEFAAALKNRHIVYNRTLEEIRKLEKLGEVFVIRPSKKLEIRRMEDDIEVIREVYDVGASDARERIGDLMKWLKETEDQSCDSQPV